MSEGIAEKETIIQLDTSNAPSDATPLGAALRTAFTKYMKMIVERDFGASVKQNLINITELFGVYQRVPRGSKRTRANRESTSPQDSDSHVNQRPRLDNPLA